MNLPSNSNMNVTNASNNNNNNNKFVNNFNNNFTSPSTANIANSIVDSKNDFKKKQKNSTILPTIRFELKIEKPSNDTFSEFNYNKLALRTFKALKKKNKAETKLIKSQAEKLDDADPRKSYQRLSKTDLDILDTDILIERSKINSLLSIYRKKILLSKELDNEDRANNDEENDDIGIDDDDYDDIQEDYKALSKKKSKKSIYDIDTNRYKLKDFNYLGQGYDENDSFIDNSEAQDVKVPRNMAPKRGGFYINKEELKLEKIAKNSKKNKTRPKHQREDSNSKSENEVKPNGENATGEGEESEDEDYRAENEEINENDEESESSFDSDEDDESDDDDDEDDEEEDETESEDEEDNGAEKSDALGKQTNQKAELASSNSNSLVENNKTEKKRKKRMLVDEDDDENEEQNNDPKASDNNNKENSEKIKQTLNMNKNTGSNISNGDLVLSKKRKKDAQDMTNNSPLLSTSKISHAIGSNSEKLESHSELNKNSIIHSQILNDKTQRNLVNNEKLFSGTNKSTQDAKNSDEDVIEIDFRNRDSNLTSNSSMQLQQMPANLTPTLKEKIYKLISERNMHPNSDLYTDEFKKQLFAIYNESANNTILRNQIFSFVSYKVGKSKDNLMRVCHRMKNKLIAKQDGNANMNKMSTTMSTTMSTSLNANEMNSVKLQKSNSTSHLSNQLPSQPKPNLSNELEQSLVSKINGLAFSYNEFKQTNTDLAKFFEMNSFINQISMIQSTLIRLKTTHPNQKSLVITRLARLFGCSDQAFTKIFETSVFRFRSINNLKRKTEELKRNIDSMMPENLANFQKEQERFAQLKKNLNETLMDPNDPNRKKLNPPRRRFMWSQSILDLLKEIVMLRFSLFDLECPKEMVGESKENFKNELLKDYLQKEIISLWPESWMQMNVLLKKIGQEQPQQNVTLPLKQDSSFQPTQMQSSSSSSNLNKQPSPIQLQQANNVQTINVSSKNGKSVKIEPQLRQSNQLNGQNTNQQLVNRPLSHQQQTTNQITNHQKPVNTIPSQTNQSPQVRPAEYMNSFGVKTNSSPQINQPQRTTPKPPNSMQANNQQSPVKQNIIYDEFKIKSYQMQSPSSSTNNHQMIKSVHSSPSLTAKSSNNMNNMSSMHNSSSASIDQSPRMHQQHHTTSYPSVVSQGQQNYVQRTQANFQYPQNYQNPHQHQH